MKINLTPKNIKEFQPGDSICLHLTEYSGGMRHNTVEGEFISYEKGYVTAKIVSADGNPDLYKHKIATGWIEKIKLRSCSLYGKGPNDEHNHYHYFDPLGYAVYESAEERHLRVPEKHPSYGMVSINRTQSSHPTPCFGSPILHRHTMRLKISKARLHRSHHEDRFYPDDTLIEVEMTPQQFTDMLTTPNSMGTPVTIRQINQESVETTPFISKLDQFETELKEKVKSTHADTKRKMRNIAEMLTSEKALGKKDREHMVKLIESINMEIENNFPFLQSQMIEEMGRVVGEAKASISAFLQDQRRAQGLPDTVHLPILLENVQEQSDTPPPKTLE